MSASLAVLGVVILAACIIGVRFQTIPHLRERARERRRECERLGHRWGPVGNACQNPDWPYRHCQRCGLQENLSRCPYCARAINRQDGQPVD